jgi:hypothetical protein
MYRRQTHGPWRFQLLTQLLGHLEDADTDTVDTDTLHHRRRNLESWFDTNATNDSDSTDPIVQIGWFQVLKGYIPN